MNANKVIKEFLRRELIPPESGEHRVLRNWWRERPEDPLVDLARLGRFLELAPDHVVQNLERARQAREGLIPNYVAAMAGYEELLNAIVTDGTAIASSSAEARLVPATFIPANFLALPSNAPGRTFKITCRGRQTTLTTAATMTLRWRDAATDVLTGSALMASGAITMDTTVQTATMFVLKGEGVVRAVGSGGSIFCMGDCELAAQALTLANNTANFMGSAGSNTPAAVAIDTTAGRFWNFTGQWSLATAYSIQAHEFLLECLN